MLEAPVIVGIITVSGVIITAMTQRRTDRDKLTESRVMELLKRQDGEIARQAGEIDKLKAANKEIRQTHRATHAEMAEMRCENERLWRLFTTAIDALSEWLRWDREGREGSAPRVPEALRDHLPKGW